jgi:hypothetical protein
LASTICELKRRLRWRAPVWKPNDCTRIAHAVLESSRRHRVPVSLIVATMINESDMNEKAVRTSVRDGHLYARDGGLMGIRCVFGNGGRCVNAAVRGLTWDQVMEPARNIALGAQQLAYWRDVGGIERARLRGRGGRGAPAQARYVHCTHRDHAYWAHYNHGQIYIAHGYARYYPHRIGVLYDALSRVMNLEASELGSMVLGVGNQGRAQRLTDQPVGPRARKLYQSVRAMGPSCSNWATADSSSGN